MMNVIERYRRIKEQFINEINDDDDDGKNEVMKELTVIKETNEITIKKVLNWANRVEAKRA